MTAHDCYVVIAIVLPVLGFSDTIGTMLETPSIREALIGVFLRHILHKFNYVLRVTRLLGKKSGYVITTFAHLGQDLKTHLETQT